MEDNISVGVLVSVDFVEGGRVRYIYSLVAAQLSVRSCVVAIQPDPTVSQNGHALATFVCRESIVMPLLRKCLGCTMGVGSSSKIAARWVLVALRIKRKTVSLTKRL